MSEQVKTTGWRPECDVPTGQWLITRRDGDDGTGCCHVKVRPDGEREWVDTDGTGASLMRKLIVTKSMDQIEVPKARPWWGLIWAVFVAHILIVGGLIGVISAVLVIGFRRGYQWAKADLRELDDE